MRRTSSLREPPLNETRQFRSFACEAVAGRSDLFHHGRVLLGDLAHLSDSAVDLAQTGGLLLSRLRNVVD